LAFELAKGVWYMRLDSATPIGVKRRVGRVCRRGVWVVAALGVLTLGSAGDAFAATTDNWRVSSGGRKHAVDVIKGGEPLRLVNRANKDKAVVYGEREYGINLVWGGPGGASFVTQQEGGVGVVRYGEKVAIKFEGNPANPFVKYGERNYGINLVWSKPPVFEWEVRGETTGSPVQYGDYFGLYNTRNRALVVYGERKYGINLVWAGGSSTPATADISHHLKWGPFNDANRPTKCTGTVTWNFVPLQLTGNSGRNTALKASQPFDVTPSASGPGEYYCTIINKTGGFRTGRWRVEATTGPSWQASCERDLKGGANFAIFTVNRSSCTK
jgi:hypothetical protein